MGGPVTVFGGTGFLGRRVVARLREAGIPVRVASRHAERGRRLFGKDTDSLQSIAGDIHDDRSVERALIGKRSADHENEGGWRHHWVLSRRGLREYGEASVPSPRAPAEMAFICW